MENKFLQLVKQDYKKSARRRRRIPRQWWLAYMALILVIAFIVATYSIIHGSTLFNHVWDITFPLPFVMFGLAAGVTGHEWKNDTAGWWLTLPFSRLRLVASKFWAGFLKGLRVFGIVYAAIAAFAIYAELLGGHFEINSYLLFLKHGLEMFLLWVCIGPFMAALGVLFGVLNHTRAKPVIPLFWAVWGLLWWWFFSNFGNHFSAYVSNDLSLSVTLFYPVAASWIVTYLLIRISAYLLNRQLVL